MIPWLTAIALAQTPIVEVVSAEVDFPTDIAAEVDAAGKALDEGRTLEAGRRLEALAEASGNPVLWRMTAVAWFEAGALGQTEAALAAGLAIAPSDPHLLLIRGGVFTEQGNADAARADLSQVLALAGGAPQLVAAARFDLGVLALESGDFATARTELGAALTAAGQANDPYTAAAAAAQLGRIDAMGAPAKTTDALGAIAEALARGDVAAARAALPDPGDSDRRAQLRRWIGEAAILRAEGRYDQSLALLIKASGTARESGLVRESAAASSELGVVYAAAGAYDQARSPLESAVSRLSGTSYRLAEAATRAQAGAVAARLGDLEAAKVHLAKGKSALGATADVATRARLDELAGLLAGLGRDFAAAEAAFARANTGWQQLGAWEDAARAATTEIELYAGADESRLLGAKSRALSAFGKSGNALAAAWVGLAEAVGRSRAKDADGTLAALAEAVAAAEAVGGDRGARFAAIARENARKLLAGTASDPNAKARAATLGFDSIVAEYSAYGDATTAFQAGQSAYEKKAYPNAITAFDKAEKAFAALSETRQATQARRNAGWARYNAAITQPPATAWATWSEAAEAGRAVGDLELEVRARVEAALAAEAAGRPKPATELAEAARLAESSGWLMLAGRCHARRAELEPALPDRVAAAEMAFSMTSGSEEGLYALYVVAVKAYEAEEYALAIRLAERIDDAPWKLRPAVLEVRDAARAMVE